MTTTTLTQSSRTTQTGKPYSVEVSPVTVARVRGWEKVEAVARVQDVDVREAKLVTRAVREGVAVSECGVDADRARDILAALGSKVGNQLRNQVCKPVDIMAYGRAARQGLQPGVHGQVVVCAPGWTLRGRDLRRAYAAVACSSETEVSRAVAAVSRQGSKYADARALFDIMLAVETQWCDLGEVVRSAKHARRLLATWGYTVKTVTGCLNAAGKLQSGQYGPRLVKRAEVVAEGVGSGQVRIAVPVDEGVTCLSRWPAGRRRALWQAVQNSIASLPPGQLPGLDKEPHVPVG